MNKVGIISVVLVLASFLAYMLFFAPPGLQVLFFSVLALLVIIAGGLGIIILWNVARFSIRFKPDENANYHIVYDWMKGKFENLNLVGAHDNPGFHLWQFTNNPKVGSQPRELVNGFIQQQQMAARSPKLVTAPGQSLVIDAVAEEL
ncbi:MAG: hypothetical protein EHM12_11580 [Dehalococcoidia bacterium]|nr:MAG: hypothetical protein EHM12_11580 [Dehalococcoidia bacterium]